VSPTLRMMRRMSIDAVISVGHAMRLHSMGCCRISAMLRIPTAVRRITHRLHSISKRTPIAERISRVAKRLHWKLCTVCDSHPAEKAIILTLPALLQAFKTTTCSRPLRVYKTRRPKHTATSPPCPPLPHRTTGTSTPSLRESLFHRRAGRPAPLVPPSCSTSSRKRWWRKSRMPESCSPSWRMQRGSSRRHVDRHLRDRESRCKLT
jgi:hypothetical protein